MRRLATVLLSCVAIGCGSTDGGSATNADTWVGTVTTESNVTTVVNESGSVWGGTATLVEEASIGVDVGEDPYMLGNPTAVWATEDRLFVVDGQIPTLRVYDYQGRHLLDIGDRGEGPGHYLRPRLVGVTPSGSVVVTDRQAKVDVFAPDGRLESSWSVGPPWRVSNAVMGTDGELYVSYVGEAPGAAPGRQSWGLQVVGPKGAIGEPTLAPKLDFEAWFLEVERFGGGQIVKVYAIPFAPVEMSEMTPSGDWIAGISESYRFQIFHTNGTVTVVERFWDPVPVGREEAEYAKLRLTQTFRSQTPMWTWNGPDVPDHKPAYVALRPDRGGRIWAVREGPSERQADCTQSVEDPMAIVSVDYVPCWAPANYFWDAFGPDGRFLGELQVPDGVTHRTPTFLRDDVFVTVVQDDAGTIMVKRYRLVLPGEEKQ